MVTSSSPHNSVIYMTPNGPRTISFLKLEVTPMIETARQIGATHWICQDGFDNAKGMPVWALFELRRCHRMGSIESLGLPTKTWSLPNIDPLWMWAMHREAARKE